MPNREISTPIHMTLPSKKDLPIEAQKSHIFPRLNKTLLSIGTFFDHGCQAIFDEKTVIILNKGSGKVMIKYKRDTQPNLYMLNLTQRNKLMTELPTPDEYFAGSVYDCKSKGTLVDYHHAPFWIPTQYGWVRSTTKNYSLLGQAYHLNFCRNI